VAPTARAVGATGLGAGIYQYEYTFVTASGESLPSPLRSVLTGVISDPVVVVGSLYADTSVWSVQAGLAVGDTVDCAIQTSLDAANTVGVSNIVTVASGFVVPTWSGSGSHPAVIHISATVNNPLFGNFYYMHYFWRKNGGPWTRNLYDQVGWNPVTFSTAIFFADASTGTPAPNVKQVNLSAIASGPTGTTQRKVYRTVADGTQPKLLTTLADNTTTTYADSTADGSLGANAPTSDTSALPNRLDDQCGGDLDPADGGLSL